MSVLKYIWENLTLHHVIVGSVAVVLWEVFKYVIRYMIGDGYQW